MSDLRVMADELANDLCVNHGLDAHDAIRDAILRGMFEALEAEPFVIRAKARALSFGCPIFKYMASHRSQTQG